MSQIYINILNKAKQQIIHELTHENPKFSQTCLKKDTERCYALFKTPPREGGLFRLRSILGFLRDLPISTLPTMNDVIREGLVGGSTGEFESYVWTGSLYGDEILAIGESFDLFTDALVSEHIKDGSQVSNDSYHGCSLRFFVWRLVMLWRMVRESTKSLLDIYYYICVDIFLTLDTAEKERDFIGGCLEELRSDDHRPSVSIRKHKKVNTTYRTPGVRMKILRQLLGVKLVFESVRILYPEWVDDALIEWPGKVPLYLRKYVMQQKTDLIQKLIDTVQEVNRYTYDKK
jgi:hypothetical protein